MVHRSSTVSGSPKNTVLLFYRHQTHQSAILPSALLAPLSTVSGVLVIRLTKSTYISDNARAGAGRRGKGLYQEEQMSNINSLKFSISKSICVIFDKLIPIKCYIRTNLSYKVSNELYMRKIYKGTHNFS